MLAKTSSAVKLLRTATSGASENWVWSWSWSPNSTSLGSKLHTYRLLLNARGRHHGCDTPPPFSILVLPFLLQRHCDLVEGLLSKSVRNAAEEEGTIGCWLAWAC